MLNYGDELVQIMKIEGKTIKEVKPKESSATFIFTDSSQIEIYMHCYAGECFVGCEYKESEV
jgi:hypothetical protein